MELESIVEVILEKKYFLGMGANSVSKRIGCTPEEVKDAKIIARNRIKRGPELDDNEFSNLDLENKEVVDDTPKGVLKSRWQNGAGKWLESYTFESNKQDEVDTFNIDDLKCILDDLHHKYNGVKIESSRDLKRPSKYKLNIYIADVHMGADTSGSLYDNKYDAEEVLKRLMIIADEILALKNTIGTFEKINIILLGDIIDGMDMMTTSRRHLLPQNMTNKEMVAAVYQTFISFILRVIGDEVAKDYNLYSVGGSNHGGDFEYAIILGLFNAVNNITGGLVSFDLFDQFIGTINEGNHSFMVTHGKDEKAMKSGMPFYLNDKTELFILDYIEQNKITNPFKHLIKADLHRANSFYGKQFRYKNVGSVFGSSDWVMKNFGMTKASASYDLYQDTNNNMIEGIIQLQ